MHTLTMTSQLLISFIFFFNDTATTEIYTLSLHDALPILIVMLIGFTVMQHAFAGGITQGIVSDVERRALDVGDDALGRSEEHTSELQSHLNLVCRLLLEKKKSPHIGHIAAE